MRELHPRAGNDNARDARQVPRISQVTAIRQRRRCSGSGWRVFFDSVGGDLNAGLALGRILRKGGFDTVVGDECGEFGGTPIKQRVVLHDSGCFSACAYAFMGGSNRQVRKDNALGVHQFYGRSSQVDEGRSQAMVTLIGI